MVLVRRLAYLASLVLIPACGQSVNKMLSPGDGSVEVPGSDMAGQKGNPGGGKDLGPTDDMAPPAVLDMSGFNTAGSPTVVITAPVANAEIHGDVMTVTATITSPTGAIIQADSVTATVTPPGGAVKSAPLILTTTANVYSGSVALPDDTSGPATLSVSAADINGLMGSAQVTYVHDHGPIVKFVTPAPGTSFKGTQTLTVELTAEDTLHPITDISQVKAGIRALGDITLTQVTGANPFTAVGQIDLKTYQNPPLDGNQQIKAQATNSAGTIGAATPPLSILIDNAGPVIKIMSPVGTAFGTADDFISGIVTIQVLVTDASGVDPSTVVAEWAGSNVNTVQLVEDQPVTNPPTFSATFDVRTLGTYFVRPVLSVRAADLLGNQGHSENSFAVDNTPPWVTMDGSLQVRVSERDTTVSPPLTACSTEFTPLGPITFPTGGFPEIPTEAYKPLVQRAVTLRARIEDHGNSESGQNVVTVAGIDEGPSDGSDPNQPRIYVIPDDGMTPLAVDTDGDGVCDDVNPLLQPTSSVTMSGQALSLPLIAVVGSGNGPDFSYIGPDNNGDGCDEYGAQGVGMTPVPLCDATSLEFNLNTVNNVNEIFTLGPVSNTPLGCVGRQLDSYNANLTGPICVVTRAVDNTGNVAVSYPLHLCIIDDNNPTNCSTYTVVTSHCTGVYDKVAQQLKSGTCTLPPAGKTFPAHQIYQRLGT